MKNQANERERWKNKWFSRLVKATKYSAQGLGSTWKTEAAFRQEVIMAAVLIPIALLLDLTIVERLLLLITVFMVIIVELVNSAIEAVVDRIGTEHHELSGKAKDIGSATVMISLVVALLTWGMILWPKLTAL